MIKLKSLIKESLLDESYLNRIGFDFPELKHLDAGDEKKLSDLMQKQDKIMDAFDTDTKTEKWFDAGTRSVKSHEEWIKSQNDMWDILPDDAEYAELKSTIEDILTILYQDNDIEL